MSNPHTATTTDPDPVAERLNILLGFAKAVAHELGGTMLPSRNSEPAEGGMDATQTRRMRFQLDMLAEHLVTTKLALDLFRAGPKGLNQTLPADQWWDLLRPLLQGSLGNAAQLRFIDTTGTAQMGAAFTRFITLVLFSVAEQVHHLKSCTAEWASTQGCPRLTLKIEGQWPDSGLKLSPLVEPFLCGDAPVQQDPQTATIAIDVARDATV